MTSRERILADVRKNQPSATPLPDLTAFRGSASDIVSEYVDTFTGIGGRAVVVDDIQSVLEMLPEHFNTSRRVVTTIPSVATRYELYSADADPHSFEDVELAIITAHFAVSENGAVWVTDEVMGQRVIPFITQHLAVVVDSSSIVPTMHEAYQKIGTGDYGFGVFIGGPSKTADIEQSLVLGAHGPISMTVYVVGRRSTDDSQRILPRP